MALKTTIQLRRDTLAKWTEINPVLAAGEIALVDRNNGVGAKDWVVRIGDGVTSFTGLPETAYALSADVETLANELSGKIENKVKVDGEKVETLNVQRIDAASYHDLVVNNTADANTLYIVSSDHLNAFGEKITNVADGTESLDAVNYGQLTQVSTDITSRLDELVIGGVGAELGRLSANVYAKIDEVSGALDVKVDNVDTKADNISAEAATQFSAVDGKIATVDGKVDTLSGEVKVIDEAVKAITETTIPELKTELSTGLTVAVGAGETDDAGDIKYTLTQGGISIGDIVVPRDIFVETAVLGEDNQLILTLKDGTQLPVDLGKFIDTYTAKDSATIDVTVENREISAEVIDGSIVEAKIGDKAVTTAKIADAAVTETQIADKTITMAKLSDTDVFVFDCGGAQ
jgi:hypothetical protein